MQEILLVFCSAFFFLILYSLESLNLMGLAGEGLQPSKFTSENKMHDKSEWLMCFRMDFEPLEIKWQRAGTPQELGKAFAAT